MVFEYLSFLLARQAGGGFIVDEDRIRRLIRGMFPSV